ncbi:MAG: hypothetical protein EBQ87_15305 [Planctomycetes bacterium]|nr:hypothetical protein [Planctomycetota bacterium]
MKTTKPLKAQFPSQQVLSQTTVCFYSTLTKPLQQTKDLQETLQLMIMRLQKIPNIKNPGPKISHN